MSDPGGPGNTIIIKKECVNHIVYLKLNCNFIFLTLVHSLHKFEYWIYLAFLFYISVLDLNGFLFCFWQSHWFCVFSY